LEWPSIKGFKERIELPELYNRIALIVADRFDNGTLSYEDGDSIMNAVFGMMIDGDKPMESVERAWSIYLAFDEGEYDHGGSADPVESFTKPQIHHILDDAQQIVGPERRERVSDQTLSGEGCVNSRRPVNSDVMPLSSKLNRIHE
jgi:hypothetical protein